MKIITRIVVIAFALLITTKLVNGISIDSTSALFIAAAVLGLLNALVRPVLVVLTLPITILSLGLFILLINALLFYIAANFVEGFDVSSFFAAFLGSIIVSIISTLTNRFLKD